MRQTTFILCFLILVSLCKSEILIHKETIYVPDSLADKEYTVKRKFAIESDSSQIGPLFFLLHPDLVRTNKKFFIELENENEVYVFCLNKNSYKRIEINSFFRFYPNPYMDEPISFIGTTEQFLLITNVKCIIVIEEK